VSGRGGHGGGAADARAAALRREFDAAFALPARAEGDPLVALLAARVAGEPIALRVLDLAGLVQARPIVPVPSRRPELLGVSGLRGEIVPIYGLGRLLGRPDDGAPAWVALVGGGERIGLALSALEGHLLVAPQALARLEGGADARPHVRELLRRDGGLTPVLDVASLVRAITGT
jgi:purine-binding chemotaxis protein CheW